MEAEIWRLQDQATWYLESLSNLLITSCKDRKKLENQSKSQYHKTFNPAKTFILTLNLLILNLNKQRKADSGLGKKSTTILIYSRLALDKFRT